MTNKQHIVFTGGGTAGHLFPGLAVANQLAKEAIAAKITFAGTGKTFERHLVESAGFAYIALNCRPLPQRIRDVIPFVADNMTGYRAAHRFLRDEKVGVVVGLGGYASVPMARAAVRLRIPLVLLEQNVVPGRATRWLANSATAICASFEDTLDCFRSNEHVVCTGNPIRLALAGATAADGAISRDAAPKTRQLVVLGGSSGSQTLNDNVPRSLERLRAALRGWTIVHQTGERDLDATQRQYLELGIDAKIVAFVDDVPALLAESDAAVCRAGGTTLAELAAAGLPAILIPYPFATDDHQRANAEVFASSGGCVLVDEFDASGQLDLAIARHLWPLLTDNAFRRSMSASIRQMAQPDAAAAVAHTIRELAA
jgi:UDP-N-acetylglucosamine--N-acetylmuramyl-(pentapeptide) pyrophosphoryl-undecaprenol N-acetylglucosamine transferase